MKYNIVVKTWYNEKSRKLYTEVYNGLKFKTMKKAIKYLGKNYEDILNLYPAESISIQPISHFINKK